MILLHSLYQDMRTICARVVDLGDDINACSDLGEPERESISRLCFQSRDLLDEAITQIEPVLQGRESIHKANKNPDTSLWNSLDPNDQIPVSIPQFVARRLAVVVRLALMSTKLLHPDHAAFLLKALGDAKGSNGNE